MTDRQVARGSDIALQIQRGEPFIAPAPISDAEQADYRFLTDVIDEARRARMAEREISITRATELLGLLASTAQDLGREGVSRSLFEARCVRLAAIALRLWRDGDAAFPASQPNAPAASDDVAAFLTDCTIANPQHRVAADDLYRAYCAWRARRGGAGRSCHGFLVRMGALGFLRSGVSIRFWNGLSLKPAAPAHAGEDAR